MSMSSVPCSMSPRASVLDLRAIAAQELTRRLSSGATSGTSTAVVGVRNRDHKMRPLTRRGEAVRRTIRDAVTELEREWATLLGRRRFAMLKHLLRQLYDARVQAAPSSVAGTGRARS